MIAGEPVGEIEDDAGEEYGLGQAPEEAHDRKARQTRHHRRQPGEDAPGDHDPGNPDSGADLLQDDVARHFEDEIAPEKHADGKAEVTGRQAEGAAHGEAGETDIDAVDIGENVTDYRKWQQAHIDL